MLSSRSRIVLAIAAIALYAALQLAAQVSASAPDSGLYTNYSGSPTSVNWIVCGFTQQTEGCYDSGSIGPFVSVGSMLEGNPSVSGDVVTRSIYVVDSGDTSVKLYVYKKTDTITSTFDTTTVTLVHTVTLPLTGGNGVVTYMAANNNYLFIGTSQSLEAVEVRKSNLSASKLGIISGDITSITSDQYGYVTVAQSSGFDVYGPDGSLEEDGGGSQFMLGTTQAVPASSILVGDFVQNPHFHMKTNAPSTQGPN